MMYRTPGYIFVCALAITLATLPSAAASRRHHRAKPSILRLHPARKARHATPRHRTHPAAADLATPAAPPLAQPATPPPPVQPPLDDNAPFWVKARREQEARAARWAQEVRAVERTAPERAATDGMVLQRTYNGIFDPSYTQTPDVGIPPPPVHENVEARRQVQRSESARDEERRDEQRRQEQRQEEIRDERFREERRDEERRQEERDQERRAEERRQEERRNEH